MNQFLSTSTEGGLLKDYYPLDKPMSLLQMMLKKRRRNKMKNNPGMEPTDMDEIQGSNMGYSKGLL